LERGFFQKKLTIAQKSANLITDNKKEGVLLAKQLNMSLINTSRSINMSCQSAALKMPKQKRP